MGYFTNADGHAAEISGRLLPNDSSSFDINFPRPTGCYDYNAASINIIDESAIIQPNIVQISASNTSASLI